MAKFLCFYWTYFNNYWSNVSKPSRKQLICKKLILINVGGDPNPDWSGCFYKTVAGWCKYAGLAQSGKCAFGGNVSADGKDWALIFGGDFTTP